MNLRALYILLFMCPPILAAPAMADGEEMDQRSIPAITGQVTFFYYKDLDRAAAFYGETLGLKLTLDLGWARLYAVSETATVGIVEDGPGYHAATEGDKPVMLSIVTDDVDGWYARLSGAGVTILSHLKPLETNGNSNRAPVRAFLVEDPGGYTIEFFTWL